MLCCCGGDLCTGEEEARASGGEVVERGARSTEERDFNSFCVNALSCILIYNIIVVIWKDGVQ